MDNIDIDDSIDNKNNDNNSNQTKEIKATPLKTKVGKQQKEIQLLQSQLLKLQIENEKLKKKSILTSGSSQNENENHVIFDPAVRVINDVNNEKDKKLTDKVSIMRANRNSTPYKQQKQPKQLKAINPMQHNKDDPSSRGQYRVTPIPSKKPKRIRFKSKLQSIADQENIQNIENTAPNDKLVIKDTSETPKNIQKLRKLKTPNVVVVVS